MVSTWCTSKVTESGESLSKNHQSHYIIDSQLVSLKEALVLL
jgi:hypothetical protein